MTAHFSNHEQCKRQQRLEREQRQRQEHEARSAQLLARERQASNLLTKHGWIVRRGEEHNTWYLKPPGSAEMLCRGEALERKTIGMGNPNLERCMVAVG